MMERCHECSRPCAEGETYCEKCKLEDEMTVQIRIPFFDFNWKLA